MPRVSGKPQPSARPGSRHALRRSGQPIFMPSVNNTTNRAISAIVETSSEVESKLRMPEVSEPITNPTTRNSTAAESTVRPASAEKSTATSRVAAKISRKMSTLAGELLAEVHKLEGNFKIFALQHRHRCLKVITALGLHTQFLTLNLRLDGLWRFVANDFRNLLCVLRRDAVLQADFDAVLLPAGEGLTRVETAERDAALDELGLKHFEHRLHALLGACLE